MLAPEDFLSDSLTDPRRCSNQRTLRLSHYRSMSFILQTRCPVAVRIGGHAFTSRSPGEHRGEPPVGERRDMDGSAGPQRSLGQRSVSGANGPAIEEQQRQTENNRSVGRQSR
jgi:hypothetical protein